MLTIPCDVGRNQLAVRVFGESGTDWAVWEVRGLWDNAAGSVSEEEATNVTTYYQTDGSWGTPDLNISGATIQARVTGKAATDIDWTVTVFKVVKP